MKNTENPPKPHIIEFEKEHIIAEISQTLRTWPFFGLFLLRRGLQHPPKALRSTFGKGRGPFHYVPSPIRKRQT